MEVDTHTERKEESDGTLVQVRARDEDGSPDSPMQIDHGQSLIWRLAHPFPPTPRMLIHAPVSCACWCIGAPVVLAGTGMPRMDGKHQLCEECGTRLSRCKGKLHKHEKGKICQACYDETRRVSSAPIPRTKRSYDTLQPTEQWKRRTKAKAAVAEVLDEIGVPLEAIAPPPTPSPAELIHLPTSVREQIRTVRGLRIPSEKLMIKCKQLLAASHATETSTFASGAFVTDPLRYVSVLCAQSSFLSVGGDKGDDHTKLGITYSVRGREQYRKLPNGKFKKRHPYTQHFAPLIVYTGDDDWEDMNGLTAPALTPFKGDSAAFPHIFAVLQHLIDEKRVSS